MKIGLYGATGSWDFGDYAMLVHNIQVILNYSMDSEVIIFTPDKYITLKNLVDNLIDINLLERIQIVDEPKIQRNYIEKGVDYLLFKLFKKKIFIKAKYKQIIRGNENSLRNDITHNIKEIDVLLFIGGGYLQHSWGENNILFSIMMNVAKKYDKPVFMLGSSIGPMKEWEYCIKDALPCISEIMVRDGQNYSAKLLTKYGFDNYFCGPDDLFFVNKYYGGASTDDIIDNKYIVVEMMFWIERAQKGGKYVEQCLLEFVDYIIKSNVDVIFTVFDNEDNIAIEYMERIKLKSICPDKIKIIKHIDNIYQIFELYKNCVFSLSFKYHPLILALGSNKPCVGVICDKDGYYESKFIGACENVGVDPKQHILHIDNMESTKLIEMYESIIDCTQLVSDNRYDELYEIRYNYIKRILDYRENSNDD